MTSRGKHSSSSPGNFYRDLAMMIAGILLVGAAVFLLLFLLADDGTSTTSIAAPTTTTEVTTTTAPTTTTTSTTSTTTTTTIPVRPPIEVRVVVLNSIGLTGAAGRLTQTLAEEGYQTLEADDFEPEQDPSRIWFREGFGAEASALLAYVPNALVEMLPIPELVEGADIIIVLGIGYEE